MSLAAREPKEWISARHLICLIYPMLVAAGVWFGGWTAWASFLLGGSLYPLIDALPGATIQGKGARSTYASDGYSFLAVFAAIEFLVLAWTCALVATRSYAPWELVGIALSLGTLTGGIGIPAAHELIHSRDKRGRALGLLLLAPVLYMHFRIEHIYGHHNHVATPADSATARSGEGLWAFIVRSVVGQVISAWRIEERLRQAGGKKRRRVNRLIFYAGLELSLLLSVAVVFGPVVAAVFIGQAITGIIFLEATNYIEHYGLERGLLAGGKYERISIEHSWNSASFFTNSLAFNLGLHSDHHAFPQRAFPHLRHQPAAPQLPAGYLTMISIAAVPPLWRRIMDPRLRAFREANRTAQLHSGNRLVTKLN